MALKFLYFIKSRHYIVALFFFVSACVSSNDNSIGIPPVNVDIIEENNGVVSKPTLDNPGLSDENDFEAVAERQTIESDAERLKQNQEVYQFQHLEQVDYGMNLLYL